MHTLFLLPGTIGADAHSMLLHPLMPFASFHLASHMQTELLVVDVAANRKDNNTHVKNAGYNVTCQCYSPGHVYSASRGHGTLSSKLIACSKAGLDQHVTVHVQVLQAGADRSGRPHSRQFGQKASAAGWRHCNGSFAASSRFCHSPVLWQHLHMAERHRSARLCWRLPGLHLAQNCSLYKCICH